jgi:hypothetical protein
MTSTPVRLHSMDRPIFDVHPRLSDSREPSRRSSRLAEWVGRAACREDDAPPMFADQWGIGRNARRHRAAALASCRRCAVRRECGLAALADADAGMGVYGVHCGVEFTDVTPSRQERDLARLRAVLVRMDSAPATYPPVAERTGSLVRWSREERLVAAG